MRRSRIPKQKKREREKVKININFKKIIIFLIALLILVYTGYFIFVFLGVKTVDPTITHSSQGYLLSKNSNDLEKTLIVFEEGLGEKRRIAEAYLLLENNKKNISMVIYLPGDIYFRGVEEDFGSSIPISSLRYAGDFLQDGRGVEYTIWQLSQLLGIKVNNYIWFTSESQSVFKNIIGDYSQPKESFKEHYKIEGDFQIGDSFLKLHSFSSSFSYLKMFLKTNQLKMLDQAMYSNLPSIEAINKVANYESSVKRNETYAIDISYFKYLSEEMSEKGGQITSLNTDIFDNSFREFYSKVIDRGLEEERVRVEVYNGSEIVGSAFQLGRKIENSGCDVVRYGNAPQNIEKTTVYIPQKDSFVNSYEVVKEILSGMFDLVEGRPEFMTTGDIVIILGEDINTMYRF
ncbi:MAG: LytR C-terminal domain-containing protein [Candidatus Dojkabacteria bacterium]